MVATIWKWALEALDIQEIIVPKGTKLISVGWTPWNHQLCVWGEVPNPKVIEKVRVNILVAGTGHPITIPKGERRFIGTAMIPELNLVWHVFEVL